MDLRRLEVFAKVYELRSFSRAAQQVLLSQPTVSGHIKSLEDELEKRLFDRLGRTIIPTRAADQLYHYAKRILKLVEEAREAMDALGGRLHGELLLGGSTIPGQYLLPPLLGRFRREHPAVRLNLLIQHSAGITQKVLEGDLELGVVGVAEAHPQLSFEPLVGDEVTLAAPADHPLAGRRVHPRELQEYELVLRGPGSGTQAVAARALKRQGVELSDMKVSAQVGSTTAVLQAVRAGLGLGFVSRRALAEELAAGRLAEVRLKGVDLSRRFYLVSHRRRTHAPAAVAFMTLCRAELGGVDKGRGANGAARRGRRR